MVIDMTMIEMMMDITEKVTGTEIMIAGIMLMGVGDMRIALNICTR